MSAGRVVRLGRRYHVSASHRLHVESLGEAGNRETYGKCSNPYGHGHNYVVEVSFAGPLDENGMVLDLAALDAFAAAEVLARFDHANLNTLPEFREVVPTTENFCVALYGIFSGFRARRSPTAKLVRVRVEETGNNSFDFADEPFTAAGRM